MATSLFLLLTVAPDCSAQRSLPKPGLSQHFPPCPVLSKKPDASPEAGRCHAPTSSLPSFFSISEQRK